MKRDKIDTGLESLNRIKLLMEYSLEKTRSENLNKIKLKEQNDTFIKADPRYQSSGNYEFKGIIPNPKSSNPNETMEAGRLGISANVPFGKQWNDAKTKYNSLSTPPWRYAGINNVLGSGEIDYYGELRGKVSEPDLSNYISWSRSFWDPNYAKSIDYYKNRYPAIKSLEEKKDKAYLIGISQMESYYNKVGMGKTTSDLQKSFQEFKTMYSELGLNTKNDVYVQDKGVDGVGKIPTKQTELKTSQNQNTTLGRGGIEPMSRDETSVFNVNPLDIKEPEATTGSDTQFRDVISTDKGMLMFDQEEFNILTPKGEKMTIPFGSEVFKPEQDFDKRFKDIFIKWIDKSKGGQGNKDTDLWVPIKEEFSDSFFMSNGKQTISSFRMYDKNYYATYSNGYLTGENYKYGPHPDDWEFIGYYNDKMEKFKFDYGKIGNWYVEHKEAIDPLVEMGAWVGGAVLAGILTGGIASAMFGEAIAGTIANYTITARGLAAYLGEAGVWTYKGVYKEMYQKGDFGTGAVDLLFGFVLPLAHAAYLNLGVKASADEIAALAQKVQGKSQSELRALFEKSVKEGGLSNQQKALFNRVTALKDNPKITQKIIEDFNKASERLAQQGKPNYPTTKEALSKASKGLEKSGIEQNPISKTLIQAGGNLNRLSKFGIILGHDMIIIHIVEGLVDKLTELFGGDEEVEKSPEKKQYIKETAEWVYKKRESKETVTDQEIDVWAQKSPEKKEQVKVVLKEALSVKVTQEDIKKAAEKTSKLNLDSQGNTFATVKLGQD